MEKITIDSETFKVLASETRLYILKTLDGKRLNLNDISMKTKINKATLHDHLLKLYEAGLIKRHEMRGNKWFYYNLSWKGSSLLHPENSRIAILFAATIIAFLSSIVGLITTIKNHIVLSGNGELLKAPKIMDNNPILLTERYLPAYNQTSFYLVIFSCLLFLILLTISIWRYKKNKIQIL